MAATARKLVRFEIIALLALAVRADQAQDIRTRISQVATALTAGNPAQAMIPFDKSYPEYEKLSNYFVGLTSAFQVDSEVSVSDEEDTPTESKVTVDWSLTLTELATNATLQRSAAITAKLVRKNHKWDIVAFGPIEIFNPQQRTPLPGDRGSAGVSILRSFRGLQAETPPAVW